MLTAQELIEFLLDETLKGHISPDTEVTDMERHNLNVFLSEEYQLDDSGNAISLPATIRIHALEEEMPS